MQRLILAGGGHAHLAALRSFGESRPAAEVLLVTPNRHLSYSGMMPGWMAGHYTRAQCQIDLQGLAAQAGIAFVADTMVAIDAERRCVELASGKRMDFDLLSLDTGSSVAAGMFSALGEKLLPVKPIDDFFTAWPALLAAALAAPGYRLAVVGGGAAGVEVAFAAHHAFARARSTATVTLVASAAGLLGGFADGVKRRVARQLSRQGIAVYQQDATANEAGLRLSDGSHLAVDAVIAATGARAPEWLAGAGVTLDEQGYIVVDASHRSVSHAHIFAAGDVCARKDVAMGRSGVHAVHAGPVLAHNLRAVIDGTALTRYAPRQRSLYLLACGAKYAIASWGPFSAEGHWAWRWKDRIDRRFVERFSA